MKTRYFLLFTAIFFVSCKDIGSVFDDKEGGQKEITYSFSCLDSSVSGGDLNRTLDKATNVIRDIAVSKRSVTDEMQSEYGKMFHEQMIEEKQFTLIKDEALEAKLNSVLKRLLEARNEPSAIDYHIYALEDTVVNAYTFGGRIYITRAMLAKCGQNDALLYAIIGHEIGHSEVGHIRAAIQGMILSDKLFGKDYGQTAFAVGQFLTASFNQKKELEADYYGVNLSHALGYDLCTVVAFWKEMANRENSYSEVEDFFRTHPFSNLRAECLVGHILTNFDQQCDGVDRNNILPQVVREAEGNVQ